jgi:hypothetical protein
MMNFFLFMENFVGKLVPSGGDVPVGVALRDDPISEVSAPSPTFLNVALPMSEVRRVSRRHAPAVSG